MFLKNLKKTIISYSKRFFNNSLDPNYHMKEFVELRGDAKTLPTKKMRESMLSCVVGDDDYDEDSSMRQFQDKVQQLFGKQRALFFPCGTMSNMAGLYLNAKRDDIILQGDYSHLYKAEIASQQVLGFKQFLFETMEDGALKLNNPEFSNLLKDKNLMSKVKVLSLENTHNFKGGRVLPLDYALTAKTILQGDLPDLKFHLDGSRILNAAVFHNIEPKLLVKDFDTVTISLSKGLGAPFGSMILCDDNRYLELKKIRKALGGTMRQSGLLASCAMIALEDWKERMKKDNLNAQKIAKGLSNIQNLNIFHKIDSNIVIMSVNVKNKEKLHEAVKILSKNYKVNIGYVSFTGNLRVVTHHQVDESRIDYALEKMKKVFCELFSDS